MHPLILSAFVLSGFSSLVLETIWIRYLEHVFGATTLAVSTVLTCFMGGLALGSWWFGRRADRMGDALVAYGLAEGIIGVFAFVIPPVVHHLYPYLNEWMHAHLANNFLLFSTVRFVAVALLLLVPTTAMGATLPLLSKYVMERASVSASGQRIGWLYTANTVGAVLGTFLTAFVLLRTVGLWTTCVIAGTIDLVLCAVIVAERKKWHAIMTAQTSSNDEEDDVLAAVGLSAKPAVPLSRTATTAVITAFFVSGLASMNLQVVWNRVMALVIGSSVYSFAIVLIAFLVGLALGTAVWTGPTNRTDNPARQLGWVQLAIAVTAMGSFFVIDDLPLWFASLVTSTIDDYASHVGAVQFLMFIVCSLVVLPVTVGMGAAFPLTIKAVTRGKNHVGADVGRVYAMNTLGAILGSFLSAFVFVPTLSRITNGVGMQATMFLSIGLYAASAAFLLATAPARRTSRRWLTAAVPLLAAAAFSLAAPRWDAAKMTMGLFRLSLAESALNEETWGDPDIRAYFDGVTTTVSLEMWGRHMALKNNGKVDASNGDDMPTQVMVAAYPLLLHPKGPRDLDVAVVGFGSGVTVGSALQFPVRHVDCVELEEAVVRAAAAFGRTEGSPGDTEFNVNHLVFRSPDDPNFHYGDPETYVIDDRLRLYADDGRNFLAVREGRYDVIISEPSNPWITGVANMFTAESFASSARALKKGGIFAQWVQLYEMSPDNIKTILRTFASVFPHVILFSAEDLSSDTVLLGSFSPIALRVDRIAAAMEIPSVRTELERAYIHRPTDVLARVLLADERELWTYTDDNDGRRDPSLPINTDDNAYIEFAAPKDLIAYARFAGYLATIYTSEWPFGRILDRVSGLGTGTTKARRLGDLAFSLLQNGRKKEALRVTRRALAAFPDDAVVRSAHKAVHYLLGRDKPVWDPIAPPSQGMGLTQRDRAILARATKAVYAAARKKAPATALEIVEALPAPLMARGGPAMRYLEGYAYFLNAQPEDSTACSNAIDAFEQLLREHEDFALRHLEVYYFLALCHDNALNFDKAVGYIQRFVDQMERRDRALRIAAAQSEQDAQARAHGAPTPAPNPLISAVPKTTDDPGITPKVVFTSPESAP